MNLTAQNRGRLTPIAMLGMLWASSAALASDHAAAGDEHHDAASESAISATETMELGDFHLRNFRPTHNETASIRFSLHLVVSPEAKPAELKDLEHWQRRLRDQAIVAVRSADAADLAEPQLTRVQRLILIRLKRLAVAKLIDDIYLTDFSVGEG